jgi:hypothetical protein
MMAGMRVKDIALPAVMLGLAAGYGYTQVPPAALQSADQRVRIERSAYYSGCNQVRAEGKAPLLAGPPGYRADMDGDADGIACEPVR